MIKSFLIICSLNNIDQILFFIFIFHHFDHLIFLLIFLLHCFILLLLFPDQIFSLYHSIHNQPFQIPDKSNTRCHNRLLLLNIIISPQMQVISKKFNNRHFIAHLFIHLVLRKYFHCYPGQQHLQFMETEPWVSIYKRINIFFNIVIIHVLNFVAIIKLMFFDPVSWQYFDHHLFKLLDRYQIWNHFTFFQILKHPKTT